MIFHGRYERLLVSQDQSKLSEIYKRHVVQNDNKITSLNCCMTDETSLATRFRLSLSHDKTIVARGKRTIKKERTKETGGVRAGKRGIAIGVAPIPPVGCADLKFNTMKEVHPLARATSNSLN